VVGEEAVLDAVRKCRASLHTDRAVAYRKDRGIEHEQMAVVVQRMVRADAAGVAMTLNPANGDRCIIAIESAFGLGETVVGGTVTPDRFLVDKVMLDVVETHLADKHVELTPEGLRDVEPERRGQPSLTAEQVRAIATLAKRAERHHGSPQDLEWAVQDGEVLLLQCRPETVWSKKTVPRPAGLQSGLLGIVDTLVNPLASRRSTHVRTPD
jgi:pyruvate,water dikinase